MSAGKAKAALAALDAHIARLESELAAARERATRLRVYLEVEQELEGSGADTTLTASATKPVEATRRPAAKGRGARIAQAAEEILREAGHPLKPPVVVERLAARGLVVSGEPKRATGDLSAILKRHPNLVPSRKLGWSLREWGGHSAAEGEPAAALPQGEVAAPISPPDMPTQAGRLDFGQTPPQ